MAARRTVAVMFFFGPGFCRRFLNPDPQVVPCGLTGHGVGVRIAVTAFLGRQQFGNHVVQQEAFLGLGRVRVEVPCAGTLADRIPRPHRVAFDPFHETDLDLDAAVMADHPDPVVVFDAFKLCLESVHIQTVARCESGAARRFASPMNGTSPSAAG